MYHHCLSIKITSLCSEGSRLTEGPSWSCCCHFSIKSVASRRFLILLLSRSGTSHVRKCVAAAASLTQCPSVPRLLLTSASALACSLVMRLVLYLWEIMFSWASVALRLSSEVLWHALRTSAQIASCVAEFPERTAQFGTCCFVGGTAVRELLRSRSQIFAGVLQFVLLTILVFLGPVELLSHL